MDWDTMAAAAERVVAAVMAVAVVLATFCS